MTSDQITKIRTVMKKALELVAGERITFNAFPPEDKLREIIEEAYRTCEIELEQALALLPCSTCGGTKIKKPESGCGMWCLSDGGNCRADCPCPDC